MAALHVVREAVGEAGWGSSELADAALVVGTSRGNAAGWLGPWPGRRPFKLMSASNTIHSEPASAISIEFGITGPNHVVASGCAAGLDAAGVAMMMLKCGLARRAVVVAVDLPLVPLLLDNYAASGLLSSKFVLDPYLPEGGGFSPGEGAAAMLLDADRGSPVQVSYYTTNSDANDPVGIPADGGRTPELIRNAIRVIDDISAVCPHATGTAVQARAEPEMLARGFSSGNIPPVHLLKPYLGHTIGASGLLESVVLARFLKDRVLPPNQDHAHSPSGMLLPKKLEAAKGSVAKLSHGMGGHNSLLIISPT